MGITIQFAIPYLTCLIETKMKIGKAIGTGKAIILVRDNNGRLVVKYLN